MVTWPMTSRDPKGTRSWPRNVWGSISRQSCEIVTWRQQTTNRKGPSAVPMVTWPMTSRDPCTTSPNVPDFSFYFFEWWGAGVVICLRRGADCIWASWCHCHSLSLASVKSRLVLVPAHPGNPGQSPEGHKTDVCMCHMIPAVQVSDSHTDANTNNPQSMHAESCRCWCRWTFLCPLYISRRQH